MGSIDISSSLDKIRKHIDYNYVNDSGEVVRSNKTALDDHLSRVTKNDPVYVSGEKNGTAIVPLLTEDITDLIVAFL
jgi:hypothetical protein